MYGCRRSPNRKLNHTNSICGSGNQITCFGCYADDEFIFVTKLSGRCRGAEETQWTVCVYIGLGNGEKRLANKLAASILKFNNTNKKLFSWTDHRAVSGWPGCGEPEDQLEEKVPGSVWASRTLSYFLLQHNSLTSLLQDTTWLLREELSSWKTSPSCFIFSCCLTYLKKSF